MSDNKLTLEMKKAFMALYYGQNVLNGTYKVYYNSLKTLNNRSFLLLKPLSLISHDNPNNIYSPLESDLLRSQGFALSWMGITVNEMIEAGWIKLRQE